MATLVIAILAVGLTAFLVWKLSQAGTNLRATSGAAADTASQDESAWGAAAVAYYQNRPTSVSVNRSPDVGDGFRGDAHPLLHGQTRLNVAAYWARIGLGRSFHYVTPPEVYAWYTSLRPARPQQVYTERELSVFLPQTVGEVGQLWALDPASVVKVLQQFHPHASMHLVAFGRRAGPEGAFAILRAVSPSHLDIYFRIHAEFFLTPQAAGEFESVPAWYTPAYLSGRIVVNKETGTVDYFHLELPNDKARNVFLTAIVPNASGRTVMAPDVVRVERMELIGGEDKAGIWTSEFTPDEARRRLTKVFYKFLNIDWVPLERVVAEAQSRKRPIYGVVSWGALDDQSC